MSEMNINNTRFHEPLSLIEFQCTSSCNMRCFFCGDSIKNSEMLTLDLVKKVVEEVDPIGISFTGGEPLLNPNLLEIVKWCSNFGAIVQINTNGLLLTDRKVIEFEEAGLNLWHISRHYSNATRGKIYQGISEKNFNSIGIMIEWIADRKVCDLNVETTLNITNLYDLQNIHNFLYNVGVTTHEVVPVMMSGHAKSNRFTIPLDILYQTLDEFLANKKDMFVKIGCLPITPCSPQKNLWKYDGHNKVNFAICKEGFERLHIHNNGDIIICDQTFPLSETPIGNAKTDSIWNIYENNPVIKAWREKPKFCEDCYGDKCRNTCQGSVFEEIIYDYPIKPIWQHTGFGWKKFI